MHSGRLISSKHPNTASLASSMLWLISSCRHQHSNALRTTAARHRPATAVAAAVPGKRILPQGADPKRILFCGGMPARTEAETLEKQLTAVCEAAGCQLTCVQVMRFDSEKQQSRFATGWLHKGFAMLAFLDEASLSTAMGAIRTQLPDWGAAATMGPAKTAPPGWPAQLTYTEQELAVLQEQQAALELRRAHNRRQRRRQSQRAIYSVEQLLSGLQQPFGMAAEQLYRPLLGQQAAAQLRLAAAAAERLHNTTATASSYGRSSSSRQQQREVEQPAEQPVAHADAASLPTAAGMSAEPPGSSRSSPASTLAGLPSRLQACMRWPAVLGLLQHQHQHEQQPSRSHVVGPIQLLPRSAASVPQVEQQLLLDWSCIPAVVDPAFGGRLADADVVRAGKGRMNLRVLRKRVQVESFALLLWQLTQHAVAQRPSAAHSDASTTATTTNSSSGGSSTSNSSRSRGAPLHVVEFGSGSGNLILPLAHLFPHFTFTAVDMKPSAVQLLQQRVVQSGLTNVTAHLGRIEEYTGAADVVLALHACGSATDWALMQAAAHDAAFIVSPCCIGKINRHSSSSSSSTSPGSSSSSPSRGTSTSASADASSSQPSEAQQAKTQQPAQQPGRLRFPGANKGLQYPRSQRLQQQMCTVAQQVQQEQDHQQQQPAHATVVTAAEPARNKLQEAVLSSVGDSAQEQCQGLFSILAASADYSHQDLHSHPQLAGLAKTNVELDRGMRMKEAGYRVGLVRLLQPELTAKSDVLVGEKELLFSASGFGFGWDDIGGTEGQPGQN